MAAQQVSRCGFTSCSSFLLFWFCKRRHHANNYGIRSLTQCTVSQTQVLSPASTTEYKAHISSLNSALLSDDILFFVSFQVNSDWGHTDWKGYLAKELLMLKYAQMGKHIKAI